jgi:hypothetical protein
VNQEQFDSLPKEQQQKVLLATALGYSVGYMPHHRGHRSLQISNSCHDPFNIELRSWKPEENKALMFELVQQLVYQHMAHKTFSSEKAVDICIALTKREELIREYIDTDPHGHIAKWKKLG